MRQLQNSCISTLIENWTYVFRNLLTENSPYYHLLKYLLLLKYPVYIYIYAMYILYVLYIFNEREIWAFILLASYTLKVPDILALLNHILFFRPIFIKVAYNKFHWNFSSGSPADTWGRTDVTKLIGAFRDCTTAPKTTVQFFVDFLLQY